MAIAVMFEFDNTSLDKYDQALREAPELSKQPDRLYHVTYKTDTGWGVVDVWDSAEAFAKFGEILGPVMARLGLNAQPAIHPVHNIMK